MAETIGSIQDVTKGGQSGFDGVELRQVRTRISYDLSIYNQHVTDGRESQRRQYVPRFKRITAGSKM